jgi:hypothetical protein
MQNRPDHDAAGDIPKQASKRRATGKAVVVAAAPQGLPALFERAALSIATVDDLKAFLALKREIEADDERRAFDQDFAQLQAEIGRIEATAYDSQKRRSYADLNALTDAVAPLIVARGFALSYDAEPSAFPGAVKVTAKLSRNGIERTASADMPLDGVGMRGNANMSAPQAYVSTTTHGRKLALTLLFNLTVESGRPAEPHRESQPRLFQEPPANDAPPWEAPPHGGRSEASADLKTVLTRAAAKSNNPATEKQIKYLSDLMRDRGERPETVLDRDGGLDFHRRGKPSKPAQEAADGPQIPTQHNWGPVYISSHRHGREPCVARSELVGAQMP